MDYIVVEGERNAFEKEMNNLAKKGYLYCGSMNTNITEKGVFYSQLVSKTTY